MIYFYWPGKQIPRWLERVEFRSRQTGEHGCPYVAHGGVGVVAKARGKFFVWPAVGAFITVHHCENVTITGQGEGVCASSLFGWLRNVFVAPPEA